MNDMHADGDSVSASADMQQSSSIESPAVMQFEKTKKEIVHYILEAIKEAQDRHDIESVMKPGTKLGYTVTGIIFGEGLGMNPPSFTFMSTPSFTFIYPHACLLSYHPTPRLSPFISPPSFTRLSQAHG
jgi:hypothetical protein